MKKYYIAAVASILILGLSGLAQARPAGPMAPHPHFGGPMLLVQTLERLDLTKVQKSKIAMLLKSDLEKHKKQFKPMGDDMQAMQLAILKGDEKKVTKLSHAMNKKREQMDLDRARLMNKIRGELTPEQLKDMDSLMEMRMQCMQDMQANGPRPKRGPKPGLEERGPRHQPGPDFKGGPGPRDDHRPMSLEEWIEANI